MSKYQMAAKNLSEKWTFWSTFNTHAIYSSPFSQIPWLHDTLSNIWTSKSMDLRHFRILEVQFQTYTQYLVSKSNLEKPDLPICDEAFRINVDSIP